MDGVELQASIKDQLLAHIEAILGQDGLAIQAGYQHSPMQYDYACRAAMILAGYEEDTAQTSIGMLEAGTGTGKSLAYLVALASYAATTGHRTAISTHSRQLQRQLLDGDSEEVLGWIQELTGVSLKLARRVGLSNYVSPRKIRGLLDALGNKSQQSSQQVAVTLFLRDLQAWAKTGSGILDDFLQEHGFELPEGLSSSQVCLDNHSDASEKERYRADVEASQRADIVVINHALLVLHSWRWGELLDNRQETRPLRSVVVDEAHKLPAIAESILSESLSVVRCSQAALQMSKLLDTTDHQPWRELHEGLEQLQDFLANHRSSQEEVTLARYVDGLPSRLNALAKIASNASMVASSYLSIGFRSDDLDDDDLDHIRGALDDCQDLVRMSNAFDSMQSGTPIVYWSPIRQYPNLSVGSADAGQVMGRLWTPLKEDESDGDFLDLALEPIRPPRPRLNSVLLTSATLAVPGKSLPAAFDRISRQLGVVRHLSKRTGRPVHNVNPSLMAQHEPDYFGAMSFVLADPRCPPPAKKVLDRHRDVVVISNPEWLDYTAAMVAGAHRISGGDRVLVLTNSWNDTGALASRLRDLSAPLPLLVHQQGEPLRSLLQTYIDTPGAILVTPSGWEGVDLPGLVPNIVIQRIPFPPLERNETVRKRLSLEDQGYSPSSINGIIRQQDLELVRQMLAQGMGRGIRRKTDETVVWVADPRFPQPGSWSGTFDSILESGALHNRLTREAALTTSIPERFRQAFEEAQLFADGQLYNPEVW